MTGTAADMIVVAKLVAVAELVYSSCRRRQGSSKELQRSYRQIRQRSLGRRLGGSWRREKRRSETTAWMKAET